jgi:hypothetical protein
MDYAIDAASRAGSRTRWGQHLDAALVAVDRSCRGPPGREDGACKVEVKVEVEVEVDVQVKVDVQDVRDGKLPSMSTA